MTKFKVSSYLDHNGRQRYTVHDVPIFSPVGKHRLEDGTEYNFDESYVRDTFNTMKSYEDIDEIRPAHENHWNFAQWIDGKIPSPDFQCPNFGKLVNFSLIEKENEPFIFSNITALTWKDLLDLENYAGRSPQILNPDKKKIDSLAFLKSIPPAQKGLGQMELDLSEVAPPEDEEEKSLSRKSSLDVNELTLGNIINFSEANKDEFRKAAIPFLVEEENVNKKGKKSAKFSDDDLMKNDDDESTDDVMDMGDNSNNDDTGDGNDIGGSNGGNDVSDSVADNLSNVDAEPQVKEVAVVTAEVIEDKLEKFAETFSEKIQFMLDKVVLQLQQASASAQAPAPAPASAGTPAPGGFSEKDKKLMAANFSEMKSKIDKIEEVQIKPNDETVVSKSKPILTKLVGLQMEAVSNFNKKDSAGLSACFQEMNKVVAEALPDEVNPPNMTASAKQLVSKKLANGVPAHLAENPGIGEAWEEFCKGERKYSELTGRYRSAVMFREPSNIKDPKEAYKSKIEHFLTYYNTVYKVHNGITEPTRVLPIE